MEIYQQLSGHLRQIFQPSFLPLLCILLHNFFLTNINNTPCIESHKEEEEQRQPSGGHAGRQPLVSFQVLLELLHPIRIPLKEIFLKNLFSSYPKRRCCPAFERGIGARPPPLHHHAKRGLRITAHERQVQVAGEKRCNSSSSSSSSSSSCV